MPTIHKTSQEAALQLTRDNARWGGSTFGQPVTVTFAFRASDPTPTDPEDTPSFSVFNQAQINATLKALQSWSDVARINFVQQFGYTNSAAMLFGNYSDSEDGSSAFAYFPGNPNNWGSAAGDVWINMSRSTNQSLANGTAPIGGYGMSTLVHEIGHALGLEHPGEYNAGPDVTITYATHAEYIEDTRQYSVMSYFSETNAGGNYGGRYAAAPQLHDILAVQRLYGANMTTRTGDTVYGFNSNTDRDWFSATSSASRLIFAAWDAGGIDTFDFSGFTQAQSINLNADVFSNVGGLVGNVVIAVGVTIENAVGGWGNDVITGNNVANYIHGMAGADTISALAGADLVFGGAGSDTIDGGDNDDYLIGNQDPFILEPDVLFGGAGSDTIYAERSDTISGGTGYDVLYAVNSISFDLNMTVSSIEFAWLESGDDFVTAAGQASAVTIYSGAGNDTVIGSALNDVIYASPGADSVNGGGGDDVIIGDLGADSLFGGDGSDVIHFDSSDPSVIGGNGYDVGYIVAGGGVFMNAGASSIEFIRDFAGGNDTILGATAASALTVYAGNGHDGLDGSSFFDVFFGELGDDALSGNGGNDVLVGGAGSDYLAGGAGNDALYGAGGSGGDGVQDVYRFMHSGASNADAVYDFQAFIDKIDLTAFGSSFASVSIINGSGNANVYLNGQLVCTVVGAAGALSFADFLI